MSDLRSYETYTWEEKFLEIINIFQATTGIDMKVEVKDYPKTSITVLEHSMYVIGEILHNIYKHSKATEVYIDIESTSQLLDITISDNGVGFSIDEAIGAQGHYGLVGMKERIQLMNGAIAFESDSSGTTISFTIPLREYSERDYNINSR